MSNTYRNIHNYAFTAHQEAFTSLLQVFNEFPIRYFLIGAQARDVHFYQKGIKPTRSTRDIDFAVMVESMKEYQDLFEKLTSNGFEGTQDPYRLVWGKGQTIIDLLPYGQIEENHTVNFDQREISLSVLGFRELNDELEEYYLDEARSLSISVPPLHGIFLLKLLTWDDKKPDREKDLDDLAQILYNYWEFVEEEAYTQHIDLFDDHFDTEKAAARILGRQLKKTLHGSELLADQVLKIITEQTSFLDPPGLMLQKFSYYRNKPIGYIKAILEEIVKGLSE